MKKGHFGGKWESCLALNLASKNQAPLRNVKIEKKDCVSFRVQAGRKAKNEKEQNLPQRQKGTGKIQVTQSETTQSSNLTS